MTSPQKYERLDRQDNEVLQDIQSELLQAALCIIAIGILKQLVDLGIPTSGTEDLVS